MAQPTDETPRPHQVLVVSQEPADLGALAEQLGEEQYQFARAESVEEGLDVIIEQPPDLVLLDLDAPGADRGNVCRGLRTRADMQAIPIVLIVDDEEEITEDLLEMGADGFIERPFRSVRLRSRVRTLLRMKEWHEKVAEQNRELLEVNARLDSINQELMSRNRELEQSMEMARRLQDALLPQKYPRVSNIGFSHMYSPAEAVGGDVFHIAGLDEDRAGIFLVDVSGHGIRAALITSIVKAVIDYIDFTDKSPTDVLKDFNSRFRSVLGPLAPQIYATGVIMMFNGPERIVSLANAGHPCPLLINKDEMTADRIMGLEDAGPALGFVPDPQYPSYERELDTGDIVLSFTDGIYEVTNDEGQMFGLERMQDLVSANTHLIPRDLIQKIVTETEDFMTAPRRPDDVCIVAVEIH